MTEEHTSHHRKPTVGRVVHYLPGQDREPWAAIVTEVNDSDPDVVGLTIFPPASSSMISTGFTSVLSYRYIAHVGTGWAEAPYSGRWDWPPRA